MKCRWFQFQINRALDDDGPLPERVTRHLDVCAACREYHAGQRHAVAALRRGGAVEMLPGPSPFLAARIANRIQADESRPAPRFAVRWAALGAFAMAVMATVWLMSAPEAKKPDELAGVAAPVTPPAAMSVAWLESTTRFATGGGNWLQAATNLDQPLQTEMDLVISDARAALHSLAADLVPSALLARSE